MTTTITPKDVQRWAEHLVGHNADRQAGALAAKVAGLLSPDPLERQINELSLRKWVKENQQTTEDRGHAS